MTKKLGRPTLYIPEYCEKLIEHMEQGLSFESFAGTIGVCKQTLYDWLKANPDFLDAKRVGAQKSMLFWEKLGIQGASGNLNGFNASSWIFNMKNRFNWRDKVEQDHTSSDGSMKQQVNITMPSNGREKS